MSRLPIPPDWAGDWRCVQVEWPDSPYWTALLHGWLSQFARGWSWDETTGDLRGAIATGKEIWTRNTPLTDCAGENIPTPTPELRYIYIEEEEDDMSCSHPCIRWSNGVLQYLDCGEWVDVPGEMVAGPVPPPDAIDDPEVPQPGDDPGVGENIKCRVAWMYAHAMWRVHERLIDYIDDVIAIFDIANKTAADLPEYTLNKYWTSSAAAMLLLTTVPGIDTDAIFATEEEYVPDLANWMEKFLPSKYSLSFDEMTVLMAGLATYSFNQGIEINLGQFTEGLYWVNILDAIGRGTLNELAAQARTLSSEEYSCDDRQVDLTPVEPPKGSLRFTGTVTKISGAGSISGVVSGGGSILTLTWTGTADDSEAYTGIDASAGLIADGALTYFVVRGVGADTPIAEWQNTYVSPLRDTWNSPRLSVSGEVLTAPIPGMPHPTASVLSTFPSGTPTLLDISGKKNPRDPGGAWSVSWTLEILDAG